MDEKMKVFSEDEMKEIVAEIAPLIEKMQELMKKYKIDKYIDFTSWSDGTVFVRGSGLEGWSIDRNAEGFLQVSYNYSFQFGKENIA